MVEQNDAGNNDTGDFPDADLVTITSFGYRFDNIPPGLAEDLITLEKEGAVYAHFADEELGPDDFGNWSFRY